MSFGSRLGNEYLLLESVYAKLSGGVSNLVEGVDVSHLGSKLARVESVSPKQIQMMINKDDTDFMNEGLRCTSWILVHSLKIRRLGPVCTPFP